MDAPQNQSRPQPVQVQNAYSDASQEPATAQILDQGFLEASNRPRGHATHQNAQNPVNLSEIQKDSGNKSFADIFKDNRDLSSGFKLTYISDLPDSEDDDVIMQSVDNVPFVDTWGFCLIGCFTGRYPGRPALDALVKSWGVRVRVLPHGRDWTVFRFLSEEDLTRVFKGGPYMCFGKTLMLRVIDRGTRLTEDLFTRIPTWVQLPGVPLAVWGESGLSRLASRVGRPYYTDQVTRERSKINYARCLIDVDVTRKPVLSFGVQLPEGGGRYTQSVRYESYPDYCCDCRCFGHSWFTCPKRPGEGEGQAEVVRPRNSRSRGGSRRRGRDRSRSRATPAADTGNPTIPVAPLTAPISADLPDSMISVDIPVSMTSMTAPVSVTSVTPMTDMPALTSADMATASDHPALPVMTAPLIVSASPFTRSRAKSLRQVDTTSGGHENPLVVSNSFEILSHAGEPSFVPKESNDVTGGTITSVATNPPPRETLDVVFSDFAQVTVTPEGAEEPDWSDTLIEKVKGSKAKEPGKKKVQTPKPKAKIPLLARKIQGGTKMRAGAISRLVDK